MPKPIDPVKDMLRRRLRWAAEALGWDEQDKAYWRELMQRDKGWLHYFERYGEAVRGGYRPPCAETNYQRLDEWLALHGDPPLDQKLPADFNDPKKTTGATQ